MICNLKLLSDSETDIKLGSSFIKYISNLNIKWSAGFWYRHVYGVRVNQSNEDNLTKNYQTACNYLCWNMTIKVSTWYITH